MAGVYRDTCAVTSALTASTTATNSTAVRDVQVATHTHTHAVLCMQGTVTVYWRIYTVSATNWC